MDVFKIQEIKLDQVLLKTVAGLSPVSLTGDILSLLSLSYFAVDLVCV